MFAIVLNVCVERVERERLRAHSIHLIHYKFVAIRRIEQKYIARAKLPCQIVFYHIK